MQLLPKSDNRDTLLPKQAVFGCFSGQTVDVRLLHVIHIWKAMTLSYNLAYQEIILVHPTRHQIFAGIPGLVFFTSHEGLADKVNLTRVHRISRGYTESHEGKQNLTRVQTFFIHPIFPEMTISPLTLGES